jgi:hypothetical protein
MQAIVKRKRGIKKSVQRSVYVRVLQLFRESGEEIPVPLRTLKIRAPADGNGKKPTK